MNESIFVGVAWPYANNHLHLGRVVGALLPADIFARFHRLQGNQVLMVSGSDAHGTPITIAADQQEISPQALFGTYHHSFLTSQRDLGIAFDWFSHTDTANHHQVAQDLFSRLYDAGYIFSAPQQLLYSEDSGRFLPDRYVEGTCPHCGYAQARGDQCDECGQLLDALELIEPRSILDGSTPVVKETTHLFLDLPAFQAQLLAYYESHAHHWRPHVLHFSRSLVAGDLKPRPITRDLNWGIPVPLPGWEKRKLYIWFENIIGYLSASIEWAQAQGQRDAWRQWWQNPAAKSYYFLGKDNVPFHTIIWPAELLGSSGLYASNGEQALNLPYDVPGNNFLTLEGRQFSSSRGWAVWLPDVLTRYDPDIIRYYLTATMPENRDSDFSWADLVQRHNSELVATWGNLVQRVLTFTHKHWHGRVPEPGNLRHDDKQLLATIANGFIEVGDLIAAVKLRAALREVLALARQVNGYLERAPWFRVVKTDKSAAATTVNTALQAINSLKLLTAPFLPFSAERLHCLLGFETPLFAQPIIRSMQEEEQAHDVLTLAGSGSGRWQQQSLQSGQRLLPPQPLFARLDTTVVAAEKARLVK